MNVNLRKRKGFTLIELLIVITIIGILAVALVPRISQGPARARDVQRKADINNIASALELYYSDTGSYPEASSFECFSGGTTDDLLNGYLGDNFPTAPNGATSAQCTDGSYLYVTETTGTGDASNYTLLAPMELSADATGHPEYICGVLSVNGTTGEVTGGVTCATDVEENIYYTITR